MFEMRPYQKDAVAAILSDLEHVHSTSAILPTGAGKTEIFVAIADAFVKANPTKSVLILSHLSLLTEQTYDRFRKRAPDLSVYIMQGHERPAWNAQVIISTMQTSRREKHADWLKAHTIRNVGLIIVDEAHYFPTASYQQAIAYHPDAKILGFTATPFRDRMIMTTAFDKLSYSISMGELIDAGYLVPPKLHQIVSKADNLSDVMTSVIGLYRLDPRPRQAIVYMQTISDARDMRVALEESGISAHAITQELTGDYRRGILDAFNTGEIQVLTTVNVLTAGFDSPRVDAIFMPYGTSSPTTYVQRIGRGLRPCPSTGKTHCDIYVYGDAPHIATKTYERMTAKILAAGGKPKSYPTHEEDALYNDYEKGSDVYVWNQTVMSTVRKMEKLGMTSFATMLNEKRFPKRFMENITELLSQLPGRRSTLPGGQLPASEAQKNVLFRAGFSSQALSSLTKGEASMMVSTVFNYENLTRSSSAQKFCVKDGTHAGKHVSELPHAYRTYVKVHYPDSPVAQLISQWETERKRA